MAELLEPLVSTIETIKSRIAAHGTVLRENETRTRMAMIDPLLQALGWDTANPALVTPEYRTGGWADYALIGPGNKPAAIIEAKRLGTVVENHLEQAVGYCIQEGIAYAGVTDGSHWQLYRTFEPVPLVEKLVLDVNLSHSPAHEAALKLLLLWRPNLASGHPVAANEPILIEHLDDPLVVPDLPAPAPVSDGAEDWVPLSNVEAGQGNKPPKAIRFSTGEGHEVSSWREILAEVAEQLVKDGTLASTHCPMKGLGFINSSPHGPGGVPFRAHKAISGGLYLKVHSSASNIIANSLKLLSRFGISHDTVELRFD